MTFYQYQDAADYNWLMPEVLRHETIQALALGKLLYEFFQPKSVLDVGGGPGIYLVPFKELGCEVYCIDGAPEGGRCLALNEFELVDLRNGWSPHRYFDLALCIEVAEHLQPEHAPRLIETITKSAPLVFFTAARPGQGGEGHYNERDKFYWKDLFARHGFYEHSRNEALMAVINTDEAYSHCGWMRWNGMMLGKQS